MSSYENALENDLIYYNQIIRRNTIKYLLKDPLINHSKLEEFILYNYQHKAMQQKTLPISAKYNSFME
jgi:hypothetical protein